MKHDHLCVVLDNLRSAQNTGAIFRTADAAGVGCVHLCGITCWPPNPKLEKTSLGSHASVPWQRHPDVMSCLHALKADGWTLVALETGEQSQLLGSYRWPEKAALVVGHEVVGIFPEALDMCDQRVRIPMHGVKSSLNVSCAFAIAVYDAIRPAGP